ncbi:COG1361 family protein [Methanohalophilus halophilus]|uniref:DUF11 domain-containing protein n=1 Tax=Methanohalophilus halophilus TaxID=2177 RepID=A0A1L3Q1P1_9EURY|nr:hypothetical protein [Methanohalophilus halophilus]APH38753.1 hypothetical protein BHR79_04130 [Methanohalophilus halophilus]RNI07946.1 hypothetical protein EFE40_08305 [Methanohalophilus halophilus]SDW74188.1 hypothetical protein SAMN04515625_1548 [Methanohalophilus halophilus]
MPSRCIPAILILLLLCNPVFAYDHQHEDIWVNQGSYSLKEGERAFIDSYTIKPYNIENGNAELVLYLNDNYVGHFRVDDSANNEYVHGNTLRVNVTEINKGQVTFDAAFHEFEKVWILRESYRLGAGNNVSYENTDVKLQAIDEATKTAYLDIKHNNKNQEQGFKRGDVLKYNREIMLRASYVDSTSAVVEVYTPGEASVQLNLTGIRETYRCNNQIHATASIQNTGELTLRGISLETETPVGDIGIQKNVPQTLKPGKNSTTDLIIRIAEQPRKIDTEITLNLKGFDYLGNEYDDSAKATVTILPFISINKEIMEKNINTTSNLSVNLTIHNYASSKTIVHLQDDLPSSFLLMDKPNPKWDLVIPSNSSDTINYTAMPTEAGRYEIKPATASFEYKGNSYEVVSDGNFPVVVEGTKLEIDRKLNKTTPKIGEHVRISLTASNIGTITSNVEVVESVPDEVDVIGGELSWAGKLKPLEEKTIEYTIKTPDVPAVHLPATVLEYESDDGTAGQEKTDTYTINIQDDNADGHTKDSNHPTRDNMGAKTLIGIYAVLLMVIVTGPLIAYLYINKKR